jgi:hypothetical protein
MKYVLLFLVCGLSAAWAGDMPLRLVRHNRPVPVEDAARLATNVIGFFQSATVGVAIKGGEAQKWRDVLASDSYIHLTFTHPRAFRLPVMVQGVQRREERLVNEILVSLPEGRYPAIQVRTGTNYMAVTKWQPTALQRLVREPVLELSTVKPYDHFYKMEEPRK